MLKNFKCLMRIPKSSNPVRNSLLNACKFCIHDETGTLCRPDCCSKKYNVFPEKGPVWKQREENNEPLFQLHAPYVFVVDTAMTHPAFTRYDECGEIVPVDESTTISTIIQGADAVIQVADIVIEGIDSTIGSIKDL